MKYLRKFYEAKNVKSAYTNKFNFIPGKEYEYNELPKVIQNEIEVQFEDNFDEAPDEYRYKCVLMEENEIEDFVNSWFGDYDKEDMVTQPYMQKLIRNIKKNGLNYPSVGGEGKHRSLAFWYLKKPLPYIEFVKKSDEELEAMYN